MPYSQNPNPFATGDIGENYIRFKLSQIGDSVSIDRAYDLFLWRNMHRIEVKTSNSILSGRHVTPNYTFSFKEYQTRKNAYDYAICLGLDGDNNIEAMYIIPQEYIRIMSQKRTDRNLNLTILTEQPPWRLSLTGNTYDKFSICKIGLDIFKQDNKSAFTRKKNILVKKLLSYEDNIEAQFLKEITDIFNDKNIRYPSKEVSKQFNISKHSVWKIRRKLGIKIKNARKKPDAEVKKEIIRLWNKGHTRMEIKKMLRTSTNRIRTLTKDLKLPKINPNRSKK
jgi:hypothetical protein